jgi:hypothetical protein
MKEYPSIPRAVGMAFREIPGAWVDDKLDGSSMRSEMTVKKGWSLHGRRQGLLDGQSPELLCVPELFMSTMAESLSKIARDKGWKKLVAFYEFWGDKSFAGQHVKDDPKRLSLFDVAVDNRGFLEPRDFHKTFDDHVLTAAHLGVWNWTRGFVERVRQGDVPGITFEGVVAKAGTRDGMVRAKAKTQAWIDKVLAVHGKVKGPTLVES